MSCSSRNWFLEIIIRIIVWLLYFWVDTWEAYERVILPEDLCKYKYPLQEEYISTKTVYLLNLVVPLATFFIIFLICQNKRDFGSAVLCITLSLALTGVITCLLKAVIGRPRPHFFYRCFPDGQGDDPFCCTGDRASVDKGRKSFPSGHSSLTCDGMVVLALYLCHTLKLFKPEGRGSGLRFFVCLTPLAIAAIVSISRYCDYYHHWEDILCGALIGGIIAYVCFYQFFEEDDDKTGAKAKCPPAEKTTQTGCQAHMK